MSCSDVSEAHVDKSKCLEGHLVIVNTVENFTKKLGGSLYMLLECRGW